MPTRHISKKFETSNLTQWRRDRAKNCFLFSSLSSLSPFEIKGGARAVASWLNTVKGFHVGCPNIFWIFWPLPSSVRKIHVLLVPKFGAFLNPLPPTVRTSYMEAPLRGNLASWVRVGYKIGKLQERCELQEEPLNVVHCTPVSVKSLSLPEWVTISLLERQRPTHDDLRTANDEISLGSARCGITFLRVRHVNYQGNQIHSSNLWTLGIPKMYMGHLGYNIQISL